MSAQDAQMLESELRTLIDKTSTTLSNIMSLPYESRLDTYEKLQKDMKKINSLYHDLTVEVRLLEVAADQRTFDVKAQEHNLKIKKLKEEMSKKRSEIHSQQTTAATTGISNGNGGGGGVGSSNTARSANEPLDNRNPATREAHNTKDRILQTQNRTISTLDDAERILLSTEDTAADATTKLQAQTQQMRNINEDLDQLDSEVERAKKELNAFIRRMMTDKILICFAILVLLGIILIVVFNFVIKKKDGGSAEDVVVTTPAPTLPTTTFVP